MRRELRSPHADHLAERLRGCKLGSVMCDGSPTNNCVERAGGRRGGCNAHARRGLVAALRGGDLRAVDGLELFGRLFHVDAESHRLNESLEQRFARRQRDAVPIVDELEAWVKQMRADVEPKSVLGKALGYIDRQWPRLTAFLRDPKMDLTNNEVERDLRRWVLDRKVALRRARTERAPRGERADAPDDVQEDGPRSPALPARGAREDPRGREEPRDAAPGDLRARDRGRAGSA